jgi:hypothetical protein
MSTSDDYKNYVQPFNRGAMIKPRRYQLTAIHHQATVHKKTLVIMAGQSHSDTLIFAYCQWQLSSISGDGFEPA